MKLGSLSLNPKHTVGIIYVLLLLGAYVAIQPDSVQVVYRKVYPRLSSIISVLPKPDTVQTITVPEYEVQAAAKTPEVIRRMELMKELGIVTPLPRPELKEITHCSFQTEQELQQILHTCCLHGVTSIQLSCTNPEMNIFDWELQCDAQDSLYGASHVSMHWDSESRILDVSLFLNDFSRLMQVVHGDGGSWVNLTLEELRTLDKSMLVMYEVFLGKLRNHSSIMQALYGSEPGWAGKKTADLVAEDYAKGALLSRLNTLKQLAQAQNVDFSTFISEAEKIRGVHDYLVKNIKYHSLSSPDSVFYMNRNKFVMYALNSGNAICEGYAQAYGFLLSLAGIESYLVIGYCGNITREELLKGEKTIKEEAHAWNLVKKDGKWGHVDVTWDDGGGYMYFGRKDDWMAMHEEKGKARPKVWFRTWGTREEFHYGGECKQLFSRRQLSFLPEAASGWFSEQ